VPAELRGLVDSTNAMLARIEGSLSGHERFIGNIAHQIRTPLAGIRLQAQLALREDDDGIKRKALERIDAAAEHMGRVNSQLLKLARAEIAFGRGPARKSLDLVALAYDVVDEMLPRAALLGMGLEVDAPDAPVAMQGEPALLKEVLMNLVDNALIYGATGGHAWVRVESHTGGVRLVVEDDGPGIPPEHRPPIFDHFYRPPHSPGEGCGLGLPIVREIVLAHDGTIVLEERRGGGARFVIDFPADGAG